MFIEYKRLVAFHYAAEQYNRLPYFLQALLRKENGGNKRSSSLADIPVRASPFVNNASVSKPLGS
jgi:hypothetical protein